MKTEGSLYLPDWPRFAERDWQRIQKRLDEYDQEDAAFHLQQALEKYLKAFLLSQGWELEKVHTLSILLDKAAKYKPEIGKFIDLCERVENYYMVQRYPLSLDADIPFDEVVQDFASANRLRNMLLETFITKPQSGDQSQNPSAREE